MAWPGKGGASGHRPYSDGVVAGLLPLLGLGAAVAAYLHGVRSSRTKGRIWPAGRTLAFVLGAAAVAASLLPPVATLESRRFSIHVVQHLLLGMVAPCLFALAAPVTLALTALPRRRRRHLLAVLHSRIVDVVTHPVVAWSVFVASPFVLYFTPLYQTSIDSAVVHELVHVHFLVAGCLFFWPVLGTDVLPRRLARPGRLLMAFLAIPLHAFLGVALLGAATPVAEVHSLGDQKTGAGLLWALGDLLSLAVVLTVVAQWMGDDDRIAAQEDRRAPSPA